MSLHFADIQKPLGMLHRLVGAGNSLLLLDHNLAVMRTADWVIDLGLEGGAGASGGLWGERYEAVFE